MTGIHLDIDWRNTVFAMGDTHANSYVGNTSVTTIWNVLTGKKYLSLSYEKDEIIVSIADLMNQDVTKELTTLNQ